MNAKDLHQPYRTLTDVMNTIWRNEMKRLTLFIVLCLTLILVAGCKQAADNNNVTIHGSGNLETREVAVSDFDTLEAALHWNLAIRQGDTFKISVTSDDNFIDFIDVVQTGKAIVFDLKPGFAYNIYGVTLKALVTVPEAITLHLNGSSSANLDNLEGLTTFGAELTGATALTGHLEAALVNLDVQQNAYVALSGAADELRLDTCGNSVSELSQFSAGKAEVNASCASSAAVNVDGDLVVEASQNSRVTYAGNPRLENPNIHESASLNPR